MRHLFAPFILWMLPILMMAQAADHQFEVAATAGTTGVGVDVSMRLNEHLGVRAGMSYMPEVKYRLPLTFALQEGFEHKLTEEERKNYREKQKEMMQALNDFTGMQFDNQVNVHMIPTLWQGKLLIDWHPLRNKSWFVSAGFYFGPSMVGKAYNYDEDTAFLLTLNGYNAIWQHVVNEEPVIQVGDQFVEFSPAVNKRIKNLGHASFYIGPKKDGTYYHATPTPEGTVHSECYVNRFRPYLGFGHRRAIGQSGRCTLGVECGAIFWGGTPDVITHDGVNLTHDMERIVKGNLRHLVEGIAALKVYPVIEVRLGWKL